MAGAENWVKSGQLPRDWVRVLDRHPDPMSLANEGYALPGYVWLEAKVWKEVEAATDAVRLAVTEPPAAVNQ
jgi:hypothetical protein